MAGSMILALLLLQDLVPQPAVLERGEGTFTPARVVFEASSAAARDTAVELARTLGLAAAPASVEASAGKPGGEGACAILVTTAGADDALGDEGYEIVVSADRAVLRASRPAGLFYAAVTLRQLPRPVPCLRIKDRPRFAWRGLMLDSSRHFQSPDEIKRLLDLMALHKLNVLHWHLTDDHGWRLEIKKRPALTAVGAWREQPGGRYGGFYRQEEVREIVEHARRRGILVVPEIEMPGHAAAAIAAYPRLACNEGNAHVHRFDGVPSPGMDFPPGGDNALCPGREPVYEFVRDVLDEVVALFPGPYLHVGGDEVAGFLWEKCAICKRRVELESLKDVGELTGYFMGRVEAMVKERKHTLIGWDEVRAAGVGPDAVLMLRGPAASALPLMELSRTVIAAPEKPLFFDHAQSPAWAHPPSWPGVNTLEEVYRFDPLPAGTPPEVAARMLGIEACLWTPFVHDSRRADVMLWPRAAALAEAAWSSVRSWEDFQKRLPAHEKRLAALGVRPWSEPPPAGRWEPAVVKPARRNDPEVNGTLEWDVTAAVTGPGQYEVLFRHQGGLPLIVDAVALLEGGREIARDVHRGHAGEGDNKNVYRLTVPQPAPGAKLLLRAVANGWGGADSRGEVHVVRRD